MSNKDTSTVSINIHALPMQCDLIDRACTILGKSHSDFILETACREAETILLGQSLFKLDKNAFAQFEAALKEPVKDNPAIKALLSKPTPWES